jgi:ribose transport system substrate-binding protein
MMLRYAESSASTNEREEGFVQALKAGAAEVKLIDPHQYAGADVNSAKKASENMLTAYEGKFDAIYCPNESSTEGMLLALQDRQLAGKIDFVGFDVNKRLIEAMKAGKIHGLVLQNPYQMGYTGVKSLMAFKKGEKVPPEFDTGAVLVTPENISSPEIDKHIPASAK